MNAKQSARRRAIVAVLAVLQSDKYQPLWTPKPALTRAVNDLQTVGDQIDACVEIQEAKDGAMDEKNGALKDLGDLAFEVAAATHTCAVDSGNRFLAGQMNFSRSEVTKGRDSSVLARCQTISDVAGKHVDELADYDVTPAKLKALGKKLEIFRKVQSSPRQAKAASSAATKQLLELLLKATDILDERLDGLLVPFQSSQPSFYNEYQAARLVLDSGSRASKVNNGGPAAPLAKAA